MRRRDLLLSGPAATLAAKLKWSAPLAATIFAGPAAAVDLTGTIKVIRLAKLLLLAKKIKSHVKWATWALDVPARVKLNEEPVTISDAIPHSQLQVRLAEMHAAADDIEIPDFEAALPMETPAATGSVDIVRDDLGWRMTVFADACLEVVDVLDERNQIRGYLGELVLLAGLLEQLKQVFLDVSDDFPHYEWAKAWAFAAVDIEDVYQKRVEEIERTVKLKLAQIEAVIARRVQQLTAAQQGLRTLLQVEALDLEAEATRFRTWRGELDERKAELDGELSALEDRQWRFDSLETNLAEHRDVVRVLAQELNEADARERSATNELNSARDFVNNAKGRWRCSEGNTYDKCTVHTDEKRMLNESISNRRRQIPNLESTLAETKEDRQQAVSEHRQAEREVSSLEREVARLRGPLEEDWRLYRRNESTLVEDYAELLKAAWASRADVHEAANRNDMSRLDELLAMASRR